MGQIITPSTRAILWKWLNRQWDGEPSVKSSADNKRPRMLVWRVINHRSLFWTVVIIWDGLMRWHGPLVSHLSTKSYHSCFPPRGSPLATGQLLQSRMNPAGLLYEFHETCHSVTFYFMKKDSKRSCDTTTPESIHTKDESKRGSAFAFIFGVNWPVQWI